MKRINNGLTSPMVDGFNGGMKVMEIESSGLNSELSRSDYDYICTAIKSTANGTERSGNCWTTITLEAGDSIRVECNERRGRYFLNIGGNPISFLTGQNLVGTCDLPLLVGRLYRGVGKAIRKEVPSFSMPSGVREAVESMNISVNGLAFAMYTPELELRDWKQVKYILLALDNLYSARIGASTQSVKDYLGLKVYRQGEYSLLIEKRVGNQKYWTLRLYNKHVEVKDKAIAAGVEAVSSDWLKNRLRIDLTLFSGFFYRNRLRTLADIHQAHGKDYAGWAVELAERAMKKDARIHYLLSFNVMMAGIDRGNYEEWFESYLNGDADVPSVMCKNWFENQGIDITLPMEVHAAAAMALESFTRADRSSGASKLMNRAVIGDRKAARKLAELFVAGVTNPEVLPVTRRSALLTPTKDFPLYSLSNGDIVDLETGEIVQ